MSCNVAAHIRCVVDYLHAGFRGCPVCKCKLLARPTAAALELLAKQNVENERLQWELLAAVSYAEGKCFEQSNQMLEALAAQCGVQTFIGLHARIESARNAVAQGLYKDALGMLRPMLPRLLKSKSVSKSQAYVQAALVCADAFHCQGKPMRAAPFLKMAYLRGKRMMRDISPIPVLERLSTNCTLLSLTEKALFYRQMLARIAKRQQLDRSHRMIANANLAIAETRAKAHGGVANLQRSILSMKRVRDEHVRDTLSEARLVLRHHTRPGKRVRGKTKLEDMNGLRSI